MPGTADREGLYVVLVGGAALGAQVLAGAVLARLVGVSPWAGAAAAGVAALWGLDIHEHSAAPWEGPPPVARLLLGPALVGEWAADALVRPWLYPPTAGASPVEEATP